MANENTENTEIELTDDDLTIASVLPLTYALSDILTETLDTADVKVSVGANNLPCIDVVEDNNMFKLSFFPTSDPSDDMFILLIRTGIKVEDEDNAILLCENFNVASLLGYAVYVGDGVVELRAQAPHSGILYSENYYSRLFEMFTYSLAELKELI